MLWNLWSYNQRRWISALKLIIMLIKSSPYPIRGQIFNIYYRFTRKCYTNLGFLSPEYLKYCRRKNYVPKKAESGFFRDKFSTLSFPVMFGFCPFFEYFGESTGLYWWVAYAVICFSVFLPGILVLLSMDNSRVCI